MFNLVFDSNHASIHLWDSLGFERSGIVKKAGLLKDGLYHDAIQFYKEFDPVNTVDQMRTVSD